MDIRSKEFIEKLTAVVPSQRQLAWQQLEYYNFIHFGMNTMLGVEWGDGKACASNFNPQALDTDQWVQALQASGSRGVILTAKHHDGFCLFPSKYTDYTVAHSPFKNDIVAMLSQSCKKFGMKFGLYLSPWDRHEPTYGTPEYNDFFVNQLTELCTYYGELFALWFDGACGEGNNGKKQVYDFPRYFETVRKLQPNAVTCICGPDVRWIGNEAGNYRKSEFSVVPHELIIGKEVTLQNAGHDSNAVLHRSFNAMQPDLGSRVVLATASGYCWYPAEMDVSITKGWFYREADERKTLKSVKKLSKIYYGSVGGNAALLLNVAPNKHGLISQAAAARLKEFGDKIKTDLQNVASSQTVRDGETYTVKPDSAAKVSAVILQEDITKSQRIERFEIYAAAGKRQKLVYRGTAVGYKKICLLRRPKFADTLIIKILECRAESYLKDVAVVLKPHAKCCAACKDAS